MSLAASTHSGQCTRSARTEAGGSRLRTCDRHRLSKMCLVGRQRSPCTLGHTSQVCLRKRHERVESQAHFALHNAGSRPSPTSSCRCPQGKVRLTWRKRERNSPPVQLRTQLRPVVPSTCLQHIQCKQCRNLSAYRARTPRNRPWLSSVHFQYCSLSSVLSPPARSAALAGTEAAP